MKITIKTRLLRLFYSIIGFMIVMKLQGNHYLVLFSSENNKEGNLVAKTYKCIKGRKFKINYQCLDSKTGVEFFKEYTRKLSYWTIGCLVMSNKAKIEYADFLTNI